MVCVFVLCCACLFHVNLFVCCYVCYPLCALCVEYALNEFMCMSVLMIQLMRMLLCSVDAPASGL